jgi:hypothetical protein
MNDSQHSPDGDCRRPGKKDRRFWFALITFGILFLVGVLTIAAFWERPTHGTPSSHTRHIIETIRLALTSYLQDFPGQFPPSEPDVGNSGYHGGAALLYYLNGADGVSGLTVTSTESRTTTTTGPVKVTRTYPARVQGVRVAPGVGFLDAWGYPIEYFVAYKDRPAWHTGWPRANPGVTCADVYPRACNVSLKGTGDYAYPDGAPAIGGWCIQVAAAKWLDGFAPESSGNYPCGWPFHMVPVNMGGYILVSAGPDGLWGTSDDVGDVAPRGD